MAFTLQEDSGAVTGANAYIDATFFKSYHKDRGTLPDGLETSTINAAIIRATDYLDARFNFVGEKEQRVQTTQWPRSDAYDIDDHIVFGIPFEVKNATAEYALIALSQEINPNPDRDDTGRSVLEKYERVGPLEERTLYDRGVRFEMPRYPKADRMLTIRGLVRKSGRIRRG